MQKVLAVRVWGIRPQTVCTEKGCGVSYMTAVTCRCGVGRPYTITVAHGIESESKLMSISVQTVV